MPENLTRRRIAILGSTGSIGTQALEVIEARKKLFEVVLITANNNADLLVEQALKHQPAHVVIGNAALYRSVKDALATNPGITVHAGCETIENLVQLPEIDMVLTAMVGYAGLLPTIKAIEAGKDIALANKETLVVAGELITSLAAAKNVTIYPVDSEHSAIYQCLVGETYQHIEKIILTASGGPFRKLSTDEMQHVTKAQALKHPNWCMGAKITIDSASLMNKGLEVIEAKWLFNLQPHQIEVIIHPQSIIHSMVQFIDGSIKAQMGLPDMKLPIQYALGLSKRLPSDFPRLDFNAYPTLSFEKPDINKFRNLGLAYQALGKGGNMPCVLNAANEVVVSAFLDEKISFVRMSEIIEKTMAKATFITHPSYPDYQNSDTQARRLASELLSAF